MEKEKNAFPCVSILDDQRTIVLSAEGVVNGLTSDYSFTFDHSFDVSSNQQGVYVLLARPLVLDLISGYNCSLLAYGQTGSGKTHSMMGDINNEEEKGIIPRIADDIFEFIHSSADNLEYMVKVSYVEMYLEAVNDLLGNRAGQNHVKLREDQNRGVYIEGAAETYVSNRGEMMDLIQKGSANRVIASTRMNADSSRSHSVFIISVEQKEISTGVKKTGRMYLVDLAGSEILAKTGAQGQTLQEAKMINKSLSALGNVIKALTEGSKHIPYRDSKLTRILQDSLGGNAKTALIITCSCSSYNMAETLSTIRFGQRAKNVRNKPRVNQEISSAEFKKLLMQATARETELKALVEVLSVELEVMKVHLQSTAQSTSSGEQLSESPMPDKQSQCAESLRANGTLYQKIQHIFEHQSLPPSSARTENPSLELLEEKEIELVQFKERNRRLQEEIDKLNHVLSESSCRELELQQKVAELTLSLENKKLAGNNQDRTIICEEIQDDANCVLSAGVFIGEEFTRMLEKRMSFHQLKGSFSGSSSDNTGNDERDSHQENWDPSFILSLVSNQADCGTGAKTGREETLEKDLSQLMSQYMHLREDMERLRFSTTKFMEVFNIQCTDGKKEACSHLEILKEIAIENEDLKLSLQHKSQKLQEILIKFTDSIKRNRTLEMLLESRESLIHTLETTLQEMQRDIRKTLEHNLNQNEKLRNELDAYRVLYSGSTSGCDGSSLVPQSHMCGALNGNMLPRTTPSYKARHQSASLKDVFYDGFYNRIIKPIRGCKPTTKPCPVIDEILPEPNTFQDDCPKGVDERASESS